MSEIEMRLKAVETIVIGIYASICMLDRDPQSLNKEFFDRILESAGKANFSAVSGPRLLQLRSELQIATSTLLGEAGLQIIQRQERDAKG